MLNQSDLLVSKMKYFTIISYIKKYYLEWDDKIIWCDHFHLIMVVVQRKISKDANSTTKIHAFAQHSVVHCTPNTVQKYVNTTWNFEFYRKIWFSWLWLVDLMSSTNWMRLTVLSNSLTRVWGLLWVTKSKTSQPPTYI